MDILSYQGYHAKVRFDPEDMVLVGEVMGLSDSLSFYARSVDEVEPMFHQCVDNYLSFCREVGKSPERAYKGAFNVRVPSELHKKADLEAAARGISLNQLVTVALRHELEGVQAPVVIQDVETRFALPYAAGEEEGGRVLFFADYAKQTEGTMEWTALEN